MSPLDFVVLIGTMVGIAAYGSWRTRGNEGPEHLSARAIKPPAGSSSAFR